MAIPLKYFFVLNGIFAFEGLTQPLGEWQGTKFDYSGYVKFDALVSDVNDGSLSAHSLGRDFYVPSLTPVGASSESVVFDAHARQSRFRLTTDSKIKSHTLKSYLEFDFLVTPDGNERVSNSYSPRMRHAFLTYDHWLFGQTWSTFMNTGSLPETLDFVGNADATIFSRQAQIRYTRGSWQFSLENPETSLLPLGGGSRIVSDDNALPDAVFRYNYKDKSLALSFAGLLRQLSYDNGSTINDTVTGYGVSFTGKYKFKNGDDIRFVLNAGDGLGRYIGLNISNDVVIDDNNELKTIGVLGYGIAYRHHWNDSWRSSWVYSAIDIDNDLTYTGSALSKHSSSMRVNLLHSPIPPLTLGIEYSYALRELETGEEGDMNRLQMSAKLTF